MFSEFGRASLGTTRFLSFVFALPPPVNHDQTASTCAPLLDSREIRSSLAMAARAISRMLTCTTKGYGRRVSVTSATSVRR